MLWFLIIFTIIIAIFVDKLCSSSTKKYSKLPQSFPLFPLIGNLHYLISNPQPPYIQFMKMADSLGSIYTFWFGKNPVIFVSNIDIAKKVLYSKDFAGRPHRYTGSVYSKGFKGIILSDYSPTFHMKTTFMRKYLKFHNQRILEARLNEEFMYFISSIESKLQNGAGITALNLSNYIDLFACNVTWKLLFNKRLALDNRDFTAVQDMLKWLQKGLALSNLLAAFPILCQLPLGKYLYIDDFNRVRDDILEKYLKGLTVESLAGALLNEDDTFSRDEVEIMVTDFMIAGMETISGTLQYAVLHLLLNNDVKRKCYQEIEKVIGHDNLKFEDLPHFHYVKSVISETLRISPAGPLGVPHKSVRDASLFEYNIPQGTTLMINIYAIHRDSSIHSDPDEFKPERFLDDQGHYHEIDGYLPFSLGFRQCLGKQIALKELQFFLIKLLQNYHLEAEDDTSLTDESSTISIMSPCPYNVVLKKRNKILLH